MVSNISDNIIYIYASVYNNGNTVERCIDSLAPLMPYKMFIVDNYSSDGTYEKLRKYKQIVVVQNKCTLGKGRNLAMNMALRLANSDDPMFIMDLDNMLKPLAIRRIKRKINNLEDNTFYWWVCMGKSSVHAKVPWRDLISGEEVEHEAHAISLGIKTHHFDTVTVYNHLIKDLGGSPDLSFSQRQQRYAKGFIGKSIRLYRCLIDAQRGYAFKSVGDFLANSTNKESNGTPRSSRSLKKDALHMIMYYIAYTSAYVIAHILGVYSYDKKLNNLELADKSPLKITDPWRMDGN